jgi:outer membrane protein OmpA-like peptidoglycan-associated protein
MIQKSTMKRRQTERRGTRFAIAVGAASLAGVLVSSVVPGSGFGQEVRSNAIQAKLDAIDAEIRDQQVENDASQKILEEAIELIRSQEALLVAVGETNEATERELLELQNAIERNEAAAANSLSTAETVLEGKIASQSNAAARVKLDLDAQAAEEARERALLNQQKIQESREIEASQVLYQEETRALASLNAARAGVRAVDAPPPTTWIPTTAASSVRADTADRSSAVIEREAERLRLENERLRGANEALLTAARTAPARTEVVRSEPAREIQVVAPPPAIRSKATRSDNLEAQSNLEPKKKTPSAPSESATELAPVSAAREDAEMASARALALERERAQLQEWNAQLVPSGIVLTLGDLFGFGNSSPLPEANASLQRLALLLNERPERRIRIEGHTDSTGAEEFNLRLSQERAEAVRRALEERGVSPERISASGRGEQSPVAPNNSPAGRMKNRRVEVTIFDPVAN